MKRITRRELIRRLKKFGFAGPWQEGKHPYMERGAQSLVIPGEHRKDILGSLQTRIINEAGISKDEWEKA